MAFFNSSVLDVQITERILRTAVNNTVDDVLIQSASSSAFAGVVARVAGGFFEAVSFEVGRWIGLFAVRQP